VTLPCSACTVISAVSARLRAVSTMFSLSAKKDRGERHAAAESRPVETRNFRRVSEFMRNERVLGE